MQRCPWCGSDPTYVAYHDEEWGAPIHDDRRHFEFLLLETQQAGLSWRSILMKREAYRRAFSGFDPSAVARYGDGELRGLLADPGIVRNRRKLEATIRNAAAFLDIVEEFGSFDKYIWGFVDGGPVVNAWRSPEEVPVTSPLSDALCADLKSRGFGFVGSTTIYAHSQAIGLVNDHLVSCFRWAELGGKARKKKEKR
jgi:DNA-3-methyladenine glycosylase I